METATASTVNGLDVNALFATLEQIKQNPDIAKFQFRSKNRWVQGANNQAIIKDFYGALKEDDSRSPMRFDEDEPPVLLGENKGPNPVEYLLVALSGCLTTALVTHASAQGITLNSVESRYEGDIDLRGFLGVSEDVKKQYETIRVFFKIDADLTDAQKEELLQTAKNYSPVYNSLKPGVDIRVQLEK